MLLFPGGVRETIPAPEIDKYKLMWPEQSEFVRLAAKYNATIVPFGAMCVCGGVWVWVCACVCVYVCVCT